MTATVSDLQLERELSTAVFRIFQEALTNVARHADAHHGRGHDRGSTAAACMLEIADDGIGMPEIAPRGSSLGILGMRERARRARRRLHGAPPAPRGTIVTVTVPLRFPAEQASG